MKKTILTIGLLAASSSAWADTSDIIIHVTRAPIEQSIDTRSYINAESIEQLENASGIHIVQSGPRGQNTSMFVRGTESDHTLLSINGMPIKDHSTISGSDDIGQHSMVGINNLLFIKGPAGSAYGPNAVGGAVDFISRGANNNASAAVGTYGYKNLAGSKNFSTENFFGSVSIESEMADGIDVQTNGDRDSYTKKGINLYGDWNLALGNFYANYIRSYNKSDLDGWNQHSTWQFDNTQVGVETANTRIVLNSANHLRTYDSDSEYTSSDTRMLVEKNWNQWTVSLEQSNQSYDDQTRNQQGAGVAYNNTWASAEIRTDKTDLGTFGSWRVGLTNNGWRTSVANGFRTPSLYETYGDSEWVNGNPELTAEFITAYEFGYRNEWLDAAVFSNKETDRISYTTDPVSYVGRYVNNTTDTVRTHGIETAIERNFGSVTAQHNYTYVWNNAEKLRQPEHMHYLSLEYRNFAYSAQYIGSHLDTDSETFTTASMPAVLLHNVKYQKDWVTLIISNIGNKKYQRPDGYDQYGRTATLKVSYDF